MNETPERICTHARVVTAWITMACLAVQTHAAVIYMDTVDRPNQIGWNRVDFSVTGQVDSLTDTNGDTTVVGVRVTDPLAIDSNGSGSTSPTGDAIEFQPSGTSQRYGHTQTFGGNPPNTQGVAVVSGLYPGTNYTFTFYASRIGAGGDNRETRYMVRGASGGHADLNVSENSNNVAVVAAVEADSNGEVSLTVTPGPNNNNSYGFFYLMAWKIEGTFPAGTGGVENSGLNLLFFGNSFTIGGDMPDAVAGLAKIEGYDRPLSVGDLANGQNLAYHIGEVHNNPANNVAHPSLGTGIWDFVVIQGYSTEATHIGDPAAFRSNALSLYQNIKYHPSGHGAGVTGILFETWARHPSHSFYPSTFADASAMQAEVRTNYWAAFGDIAAAKGSNSVRYAGVGDAFECGSFASEFYSSDLYHAGGIGHKLKAMVLYNTIYDEDVSDIPYAAAQAAGWTSMGASNWSNLTAWADGVTSPTSPLPGQAE